MSSKPIPPPRPAKSGPPPLPAQPQSSAPRVEKDKGFNESHGYGPSHGGPSGPGDVASKQPATVVPDDEADEADEKGG